MFGQRLILIILLLALLSACTQSRKNSLIYRYESTDLSISFDSLKSEILGDSGAEMMVVYPDSDVVIIHYDRFKTHQNVIEEHIRSCGYKITLIEKKKIEEKDQPWKKK